MNYISLFAGIGGFDLALDLLGHNHVYSNEWDKYAAQTYEKNFGHKPDTRSIVDVPTGDIPDHDLLVGGFPCQAFSVAGKRGGFKDTRGTLFFEICRILRAKRPAYFLLENVKGLLSHDGGRTFYTIQASIDELGYNCEWQVLNSKDFGVPQNRERVFISGCLRGKRRSKIFPLGLANGYDLSKQGMERNEISTPLRAKIGGVDSQMTFVTRMPLKFLNRNQKNIDGDYSYTVDSLNTGGVLIDHGQVKESENANCLDANYWKGLDNHGQRTGISTGAHIRRLTPIECERLQGFPDNWTQGVSDTQRYRQLGNAVTVNVVYEIIRKMGQQN